MDLNVIFFTIRYNDYLKSASTDREILHKVKVDAS